VTSTSAAYAVWKLASAIECTWRRGGAWCVRAVRTPGGASAWRAVPVARVRATHVAGHAVRVRGALGRRERSGRKTRGLRRFPPLPPAACRNSRLFRLPSAVTSSSPCRLPLCRAFHPPAAPPAAAAAARDRRPPVTHAACGPGPACHRVPTSWTHGPHLPHPLLSDSEGVFLGVGFPRRDAVPG
jgi:hypothetical protein